MTPAITLADRLRSCYSAAVSDVLRANGDVRQTLPHYIRPKNPQDKLAGPVFAIQPKRDDSLDAPQSLLHWCEPLSKAPTNTVLVGQPHDHSLAHRGGPSSETLV
jgi:4-hydroxy-4-methyl-2-oxoglutarate aldolase